ncbi:MAG: MarR family transcriptional regulator [Emergencia sp.]|nr:MarR family transcriptional regulator [Emergencia sp.]
MKFQEYINRLYYEETIHELAVRNRNGGEKISYNSIMYIDAITYLQDCTVSKLADRLHISKPAVTMKVNELLRQGLIEKEQSEEDRRVFFLRAKARTDEFFPEYNTALKAAENYISDRYTEEEMEIFERILTDASEKYIEELKKSEQFNH